LTHPDVVKLVSMVKSGLELQPVSLEVLMVKDEFLNIDNPNESYYEEYNGSIYYYGTNRRSKKSKKVGMAFLNGTDPREGKRPKNNPYF
jgi:hypothetical protein